MEINDATSIPLQKIIEHIWRQKGDAFSGDISIKSTDVELLTAWLFAAENSIRAESIKSTIDGASLLDKDNKTLQSFKCVRCDSSHNIEYQYSIGETGYCIRIDATTNTTTAQKINLEKLITLIVLIKYHLQSIILLPFELRRERLTRELEGINIPENTFENLLDCYHLIEKYTDIK